MKIVNILIESHLCHILNVFCSWCAGCSFIGCTKVFKNRAALQKHFKLHGAKLNICSECGTAFVEASKLKRHRLVHSGERPYQCEFPNCGKRFSLSHNLKTHMRLHTNDSNYQCKFCLKQYSQKVNLNIHIQKKHPISSF